MQKEKRKKKGKLIGKRSVNANSLGAHFQRRPAPEP